jgi:hypothetical protein
MNRYLIVCGNDVNSFIAPVTTPSPCSVNVVPTSDRKVS